MRRGEACVKGFTIYEEWLSEWVIEDRDKECIVLISLWCCVCHVTSPLPTYCATVRMTTIMCVAVNETLLLLLLHASHYQSVIFTILFTTTRKVKTTITSHSTYSIKINIHKLHHRYWTKVYRKTTTHCTSNAYFFDSFSLTRALYINVYIQWKLDNFPSAPKTPCCGLSLSPSRCHSTRYVHSHINTLRRQVLIY